jgi:hypothetical protein
MRNKCALYRHFDAAGVLLYVGISKNAMCRLQGHSGASWYGALATMTVDHFDTRGAACEAEWRAIQSEGPVHNKLLYPRKGEIPAAIRHVPTWTLGLPEQMLPAGDAFLQVRRSVEACQAVIDAGGDVYAAQ